VSNQITLDAFPPPEMAERMENVGVTEAVLIQKNEPTATESATLPGHSGGERGGQHSIHSVELWTGGGIRWPWPNS
jgi:hypothetical protein